MHDWSVRLESESGYELTESIDAPADGILPPTNMHSSTKNRTIND